MMKENLYMGCRDIHPQDLKMRRIVWRHKRRHRARGMRLSKGMTVWQAGQSLSKPKMSPGEPSCLPTALVIESPQSQSHVDHASTTTGITHGHPGMTGLLAGNGLIAGDLSQKSRSSTHHLTNGSR